MRFALPALALLVALVPAHRGADAPRPPDPKAGGYVRKPTRAETARATLAGYGLPTLEGKWYYAGPFDNANKVGLDTAYPPETKIDLKDTFTGKDGKRFGWREFDGFAPGRVVGLLPLFPDDREHSVVYLLHEFRSPRAFTLPLSFGADDTLTVFVNGKRVLLEDHERAAEPDQFRVEVEVKEGQNQLLLKVGQNLGQWAVYVNPELPSIVPEAVRNQFDRDFPRRAVAQAQSPPNGDEAAHYKLVTIPLPDDCVLEVGGLAFRPDGKLLACTRRGELWLVHNPTAANPAEVRMTRWASGLHEALGLWVQDDRTVYVVQRPELTKITDADGDGTADEFVTVCDRWGVSGDYHEFAFGPARDEDGNFFVTLNVGFGGGHQAKAPWRGWCVKVSPDGTMEPWAYGLRSPNGLAFSPDGDLFYTDNQGEWVASNKLHHLRRGRFYGHQAPLRWLKDSPFAGKVPDRVASGMLYDGQRGPEGRATGFPAVDPPAVWFPYGRMGGSVSEPAWDTTGGKFGPFAGQCFVGDQTKSTVMRVALEKVNGVYQGACFPFRSGLQCGVNRLAFAPDGSLFAGQTGRGWGSLGGKMYGLQRLVYTGAEPFEVHHVTLTRDGFDLTFTKPLDPKSVTAAAASVGSYTYVYWQTYGSPEVDRRAEAVTAAALSADGRTLSLSVPGVRRGRVYELRADGVESADGRKLLHDDCYYTVNQLRD
jgi:hypothetical protein